MPTFKELSERKMLIEMKALIKVCETTDNAIIRKAAKDRLKVLSGIPKFNKYSIENTIRNLTK